MHEYSIVQALLERVDDAAMAHRALRVHRVQVSIGEVAGVDVELLKTAFDTIRRSTICEAAKLDVRSVRAEWVCSHCGIAIVRGAPLRCVDCGGTARLAAGDEIVLERIEMEAGDV
jgi:hydrogenase nickel incorporation protein HypA/HybF